MGRHVAIDAPDLDALVDEAIAGIGADIAAARVPGLRSVFLGGGYARGEGGVRVDAAGARHLSNDLDFYVVANDATESEDHAAIAAALAPVAERWTARLGVDIDFSPPKTLWRIHHDEERLMIQDLVRDFIDVAGEPGESLFATVERRPPEALPWMEAARQLMNRGVGLLLALEPPDAGFAARNLAKCVLGAGDATLIARHGYRWRATERAAALSSPLYDAALAWKFRPTAEPPCDWESARAAWRAAWPVVMEAGRAAGSRRRTLYQAARWVARRRSPGDLRDTGLDCTVRVLRRVARHIEGRRPVSPSLRTDWTIFN